MGIKELFGKSVEPSQGQINKFVDLCLRGNLGEVVSFLDKYGDKYADAQFNGDGGSALGLAIHGRQAAVAKELIRRGANSSRSVGGLGQEALLMNAVRDNAADMVQILVDGGADQTAVNSQGRTAKDIAHRLHYLDVIKVLDPAFDTSKAPDHTAVDAYVTAAREGDAASVGKFLGQYGVQYVDALNSGAVTALTAAIRARQPDVIRALHAAGADMNVKDPAFNFSMAYWALNTKDPQTIKLVIKLGADLAPDALQSARLLKYDQLLEEELGKRDYRRARAADPSLPYPEPGEEDISAFVHAVGMDKRDTVSEFLDEFGPAQIAIHGASAAQRAIETGKKDILGLLESKGFVIGSEELEVAVSAGNKELAKDFLGRGIPVTENTLKNAVLNHRDAGMVVLLLDNGVAVDAPIIGPATMLHLAAFTGKEEIVKELIARKANTTIRTEAGDTAAQLALHASHHGIVQILEAAARTGATGHKPVPPGVKLS